MVQKRETKGINKLCVREIPSLSFVCGAYFFEFRGRNLVCFVIAYNFQWQIRAGSREDTHAHCVFHACLEGVILFLLSVRRISTSKVSRTQPSTALSAKIAQL